MNIITIRDVQLPVVEFEGQRVVTLSMVDQVHGRPEGTAKRNFSEHKSRLIEGEDFYLIDFSHKDELRTFGIEVPPRGLTVLAESGYLMLVKSFTDDLAWDVQRQLAKSYFRAKAAPAADPMAILSDPAAMRGLLLTYTEKVIALEEKVAEQAPKVQALERFAGHDGQFSTRDSAKMLGLPERKLISWLLTRDWYYRDNNARLRAKADKIAAGYLDTVPIEVRRSDGIQVVPQPVITQRGLARLGVLLAKDGLLPKQDGADMIPSADTDHGCRPPHRTGTSGLGARP